MKTKANTTEEIAKTKEPNSVHEFAEPAMLQTKLQQAENGDVQQAKMVLNLGDLTKETISKDRLSVTLPFPHFKPTKLTANQH